MPGLHITLGIFHRLFVLLEADCHMLDVKLAESGSQDDTLHSYKLYSAALHNVNNLEEEKRRDTEEALAAEQLSTFLAVRGADLRQVEFCRQAAAELRRNIATLVSDHSQQTIKPNIYVNLKYRTKYKKNELKFRKGSLQKKDPLLRLWTMLSPLLMLNGKPTIAAHSWATMSIVASRYIYLRMDAQWRSQGVLCT